MNYHQYYPIDVVNGPGTRCTLFVSGCVHQCKGCYNQSTLNPNSGVPFTEAMVEQIISDLKSSRIKRRGLSLSGGDPLHPANVDSILALIERVQAECPDKDIWLWSGYKVEELNSAQQAIVERVDMFIDGPFVKELADPMLQWRGSSNQRLLEMQGQHRTMLGMEVLQG